MGGGGLDDHNCGPFGPRQGVMSCITVKWYKMFDHDHSQKFKITVVEWSKLKFIMAKIKIYQGQNFNLSKWLTQILTSKFDHKISILTMTIEKILRCQWPMAMINSSTLTKGKIQWCQLAGSWSVPYPGII